MSEPPEQTAREPTLPLALKYAKDGWPVFPCSPNDKTPLTIRGFKDASRSALDINRMWRRRPDAMVGLPTGEASGVFVLDLDRDEAKGLDGETEIARLGALPPTVSQRTPRGGRHLFFRQDPSRPIRNTAGKLGQGVDIRGEGGFVVLAGSVRADGQAYEWTTPEGVTEPAEAPGWLYDALERPAQGDVQRVPYAPPSTVHLGYGAAALTDECNSVAKALAGQRNDALNRAAFSLGQLVRGGELPEQVVRTELARAAEASGLTADDGTASVEKTINSGFSA
ncbi:MAG: bifunctional DNA primase/polymerase, partial [Dehalococcoidia bacterium]|nr:bifunctional DNA primase/polymerase [Dehalococcoidia bacterium]